MAPLQRPAAVDLIARAEVRPCVILDDPELAALPERRVLSRGEQRHRNVAGVWAVRVRADEAVDCIVREEAGPREVAGV